MTREKRAHRQAEQDREVEASNAAMQKSIDDTKQLMSASEIMLERHRQERAADDAQTAATMGRRR